MIELLVIRHGIAEDREAVTRRGQPIQDHERRLTAKGRSRMSEVADGLHWMVPEVDLIAASPLVRAVETAELVAAAYGDMPVARVEALLPEAPLEDLAGWLDDQPDATRVAVVGHEPHLSSWCSWMLCGERRSFLSFKKGGACLMHLPSPTAAGEGEIAWFATPRQLRRLRK